MNDEAGHSSCTVGGEMGVVLKAFRVIFEFPGLQEKIQLFRGFRAVFNQK